MDPQCPGSNLLVTSTGSMPRNRAKAKVRAKPKATSAPHPGPAVYTIRRNHQVIFEGDKFGASHVLRDGDAVTGPNGRTATWSEPLGQFRDNLMLTVNHSHNAEAIRAMLQEFIATGAHYDETLRAQFPLFTGDPPQGHPYPEAWSEGTPQSSGIPAPAPSGITPFSGRGRRLSE